jgi:hypothetical protein
MLDLGEYETIGPNLELCCTPPLECVQLFGLVTVIGTFATRGVIATGSALCFLQCL